MIRVDEDGNPVQAPAPDAVKIQRTPIAAPDPTLGQSTMAYMRQDNWVGSLYADKTRGVSNRFDGTWDIDSEMLKNPDLDPYKEKMSTARNKEMFDAMGEQIRMEMKDKDTIDRTKGFIPNAIGIGTSVLADPVNLIPLGGLVTKTAKVGKAIVGTAAKSGAAMGLMGAVQGEILDSTQITDTNKSAAEFAAIGVAGGALFGGAIGGIVARKIGKEAAAQAAQQAALHAAQTAPLPTTGNAGAARVIHNTIPDGERLTGIEAGVKAREATGITPTPNLKLATSDSDVVRRTAQEIGNNALYTEKNFHGVATPQSFELAQKQREMVLKGKNINSFMDGFKEFVASYKNIDFDAMSKELALAGRTISPTELAAMKPSREMFSELVVIAGRNGDTSAVPAANNAAQASRKILKELGDEANNLNLFEKLHRAAEREAIKAAKSSSPEAMAYRALKNATTKGPTHKADLAAAKTLMDNKVAAEGAAARAKSEALIPNNAGSYHPTAYDVEKIVANEQEFKKIVTDDFISKGVDPQEAALIADDVMDTMKHTNYGSKNMPAVVSARSFSAMKARTLNIDVNKLGKFMINDSEYIMNKYIDDMTKAVEWHKQFGGRTFHEVMDDVTQDFTKMRNEVFAKGLPKADEDKLIAAITKEERSNASNLEHLYNTIMGHSNDADGWTASASRVVKSITSMASLGQVMFSSLGDVGRLTIAEGFKGPLKALVSMLSKSVREMAMAEAEHIGYGNEHLLGTRTNMLLGLDTNIMGGRPNTIEAGVSTLSSKFHEFSGFNYWNSAMKHLSGIIHADKVMKSVFKYDTLDKHGVAYLAQAGIDKDMALRIADQFGKFGVDQGSYKFANTVLWDDNVAKEVYQRAIFKLVNHTIMTPDAGTVPKFFRGTHSSILTQFMSFTSATEEQMIAAGMQRGKINEIKGLLTMVGMGMLGIMIKDKLAGREKTPEELILSGVDATGIFGIAGDLNNRAHRAGMGIQDLFDDEEEKRAGVKEVIGAVGGPAINKSLGLIGGMANVFNGSANARDWTDIGHAIPGNNLPYVKGLTEYFNEEIKDTFGDIHF